MIEVLSGIASAVVVILLIRLLPEYFPAKLIACTALCAMAFIYVGFSMQGNTTNAMVLEISMALIFYSIAIIGYLKNASFIGYGILLHGVWDLLHHHGFVIKTTIPNYWPPYCSVIDIIWGVYFILYFKKQAITLSTKINPA
jgi:hypothetical protein